MEVTTDRLVHIHRLLAIENRQAWHLASFPGIHQMAQATAFSFSLLDLTRQRQRLLKVINSARVLAQRSVGLAQVVQGGAFEISSLDFTRNRQRLLMGANRPLILAQRSVGLAQVAQSIAFRVLLL